MILKGKLGPNLGPGRVRGGTLGMVLLELDALEHGFSTIVDATTNHDRRTRKKKHTDRDNVPVERNDRLVQALGDHLSNTAIFEVDGVDPELCDLLACPELFEVPTCRAPALAKDDENRTSLRSEIFLEPIERDALFRSDPDERAMIGDIRHLARHIRPDGSRRRAAHQAAEHQHQH